MPTPYDRDGLSWRDLLHDDIRRYFYPPKSLENPRRTPVFKNLFRSAQKIANTNTLEAVIAAALLVAAADGNIEREELAKLEQLIANTESLSAFKRGEIQKIVSRYAGLLEADFYVGRQKMQKEIDDIAENPETAETVFLIAFAIARADGEVEPAEKKVLTDLARRLGQDPAEYGLI